MGYVYFLTSGATQTPIKIGRTINIDKRPQNLQTGNPEKLNLVWVIRTFNHVELEKDLHTFFGHFRRPGSEWFDIDTSHILEMARIWNSMMILDDEDSYQRSKRFIGLLYSKN